MKRREIATCIILSIITCGIYGLYWFVVLIDDVNDATGHSDDTSGAMSLVLTIITCGIYGIYALYRMGQKLDEISTKPGSNNALIYLICGLFLPLIAYALAQNELNQNA